MIDAATATIIVAAIGAVGGTVGWYVKHQADKAATSLQRSEALFDGYSKLNQEQREYFKLRKAEWDEEKRIMKKEFEQERRQWASERGELIGRVKSLESANKALEVQAHDLQTSLNQHGAEIRDLTSKIESGDKPAKTA